MAPAYVLRAPGTLGRWLGILLLCTGTVAALCYLAFSSYLASHNVVLNVPSADRQTPPSFSGPASWWLVLLWLPSLLANATIVVRLVWQHRMTANLRARGLAGLRITPA
jgi:hypothetical protein